MNVLPVEVVTELKNWAQMGSKGRGPRERYKKAILGVFM
jgi:hypothetical protein